MIYRGKLIKFYGDRPSRDLENKLFYLTQLGIQIFLLVSWQKLILVIVQLNVRSLGRTFAKYFS